MFKWYRATAAHRCCCWLPLVYTFVCWIYFVLCCVHGVDVCCLHMCCVWLYFSVVWLSLLNSTLCCSSIFNLMLASRRRRRFWWWSAGRFSFVDFSLLYRKCAMAASASSSLCTFFPFRFFFSSSGRMCKCHAATKHTARVVHFVCKYMRLRSASSSNCWHQSHCVAVVIPLLSAKMPWRYCYFLPFSRAKWRYRRRMACIFICPFTLVALQRLISFSPMIVRIGIFTSVYQPHLRTRVLETYSQCAARSQTSSFGLISIWLPPWHHSVTSTIVSCVWPQ